MNKNLKTFGIVVGALVVSQLIDTQIGLSTSIAGAFPDSVSADTAQSVSGALVGGAVVATALVLMKGK